MPKGITSKAELWYGDVFGILKPERSCTYRFSLVVAGTAKLYVDGKLIVDNATKQTAGDTFFGHGTIEEFGTIELEAGKSYNISVIYGCSRTSPLVPEGATLLQIGGLRIGYAPEVDEQAEIERAVQLAKEVDQVVICAGLTVSFPLPYPAPYILTNLTCLSYRPNGSPKAVTAHPWTSPASLTNSFLPSSPPTPTPRL